MAGDFLLYLGHFAYVLGDAGFYLNLLFLGAAILFRINIPGPGLLFWAMVPNDSFISQTWGAAGSPTHLSSCCLRCGEGFLGPGWWVSLSGQRSSGKRLPNPGASCDGFFPNCGGQRMLPSSNVYWDPLNPMDSRWDPFHCWPQSLGRVGESQVHRDRAGPFVWVELPLARAILFVIFLWEFQACQGPRALPLAVCH